MKKKLITLISAFLILFSMFPSVMAFEMERPSDHITVTEERVENLRADEEAAVGIGVQVAEYLEKGEIFEGNDGVFLRVAATANTRKGIRYNHLTYDYLWDWINAPNPTGITGDNAGKMFDLPFPVRFYGGPGAQGESFTYTRVWVCSNGFLCFDNSNSTSVSPLLGNPTKPNAVIAVYWTDLNPTGGTIKYYADDNHFVVLWDNVLNKRNGYRETFEVVIKNTRTPKYRDQNRFMFLYEDVSEWAYVGIEDQEGFKCEMAYAVSGKEIDWYTYYRAGEIKELTIIAEKSDSAVEIWMMTDEKYLRGYNMHWKSEEGDQEGLYSVALKGGLTLLLTEAAGLVWGPIGGLSMELLLLSTELAPYFSTELYKVHNYDIEEADETENIAYVNVSAMQDYNFQWPVDAELSNTISWVFKDDDGTHTIKITALIKYFSYESYTEKTISTSVNVTLIRDAGNDINGPDVRVISSGAYIAYVGIGAPPPGTDDIKDFYKIWVKYYQTINIKMQPPAAPNVNFDLHSYDPNKSLVASSTNGPGVTEQIEYLSTRSDGYWYIEVNATQGRGLYTLLVDVYWSGCPFVHVWNGTDYAIDNNILAASEISNGSDVEDYYKLEHMLVPKHQTTFFSLYSLQIKEFENEHTYIDQTKLLAVDHESDVKIAISPSGEILTYKNPHPPVTCIDNKGNNILNILKEIDEQSYKGLAGDYITLDFGNLDISNGAKLVLRTDLPPEPELKCPCIHIQVLNSTGNWMDVATISPRVHWATDIVDLSNFLSDLEGNIKIRLYFTSAHKIDYVGLDKTSQAQIQMNYGFLLLAKHSEEGFITAKLMYNDRIYSELLPNQQITLTFILNNNPNISRTFIFYTEGHYYTITPENP
jgi:hypothetical protein